jgi:hypothetical protein
MQAIANVKPPSDHTREEAIEYMCVLQIVFSIPNDIMLHPFPIPS